MKCNNTKCSYYSTSYPDVYPNNCNHHYSDEKNIVMGDGGITVCVFCDQLSKATLEIMKKLMSIAQKQKDPWRSLDSIFAEGRGKYGDAIQSLEL